MGVRKGYTHRKRPTQNRTWCGIPWKDRVNPGGAHREACPECKRREWRGK